MKETWYFIGLNTKHQALSCICARTTPQSVRRSTAAEPVSGRFGRWPRLVPGDSDECPESAFYGFGPQIRRIEPFTTYRTARSDGTVQPDRTARLDGTVRPNGTVRTKSFIRPNRTVRPDRTVRHDRAVRLLTELLIPDKTVRLERSAAKSKGIHETIPARSTAPSQRAEPTTSPHSAAHRAQPSWAYSTPAQPNQCPQLPAN